MRVGFVVECGPGGADEKVLRYLVGVLRKDIDPRFQTCGPTGKREILDECRKQVSNLFDKDRCDRVFVVWDLMPCDPPFRDENDVPCRRKEREHLLGQLRPEDRARTVLLCITHELEAWLLADGSAIKAALNHGYDTHKIKRPIPDVARPEDLRNPKGALRGIFTRNQRPGYNDVVHAVKIVEQVTDLTKLERAAPSFRRLREKLEAM
jgi:Domain of unknown function (DUF4276)